MSVASTLRFVWNHPLNAGDRFGALSRLVRWQIASRLVPGPIALPFVEDTKLFAARGMTGATGNWYCGLHEISEMAFVLHVLRPDDHFLDLGANVGSYTVLSSGAVGARTTAVEPVPETFSYLRRNVLLNDLEARVRCCPLGVSDSTGTLAFTSDLDTVNHVAPSRYSGPTVDVPVTTVDDLIETDHPPTLIKIDVEGHELAVLRGAQAVLANANLLAVCLETNESGLRYGVGDGQLFEELSSYEFQPFSYEPTRRCIAAGQTEGGNTIFIRGLDTVEKRIRSARRFQLINGTV